MKLGAVGFAFALFGLVCCSGQNESSTPPATTSGPGGTTTTSTSGGGSGGGCSAPCPSGICEDGECKDNQIAASAWPGSKYDAEITRLADGTFFSAGGNPSLDTIGHGLTASHVAADGTTVLAQVDCGTMTSAQSERVTRVIPIGSDVLVLDSHTGDPLDIGGGVTITGNVFVAARLGVDGTGKWATLIQGVLATSDFDVVGEAAVDGAGNVWLYVLPTMAPFRVNGVDIAATNFSPMILKLDPSTGQLLTSRALVPGAPGACAFSNMVCGGAKAPPHPMMVGTDSGFVIAGEASGQCDFGGGPIPSAGVAYSMGYAARFDASISHVWSRVFPGGTAPNFKAGLQGTIVAMDGATLYVAGEIFPYQAVDFGTGPVTGSMAVARLDPATGDTIFAKAYAGTATYHTTALGLVASPGGVAVAGKTDAGEDFGVSDLGPGSGAYVLKLDPTGGSRWLHTYAGVDALPGLRLLSAGDENVVLVAHGTSMDFGQGPLADSASKLALAMLRLP